MTEREQLIAKFSKLHQYKNYSKEEIENLVDEKLLEKQINTELIADIDILLVNEEEKKFASELYKKYLKEFTFETSADKTTLSDLIYLEIIAYRQKKFLTQEYSLRQAVPANMVEEYRNTIKQIMDVKKSLGMVKDKTSDNFISTWEMLKKKVLVYFKNSAGTNIVRCPHCRQLFHMILRTELYTPEKLSWFKNTLLYNDDLLKLYHEKRVNEEEVAKILGCSTFYVPVVYELYLKEKQLNDNKV